MEPKLRPNRSVSRRLALPVSGLIALCAFVHACGGGGGGGGGSPPPVIPPPTTFLSNFQFPANNATDVPRQPVILIGFSDIVNPATISATTVSLSQGATGVPSTLSYDACANRIQVVPNAALDPLIPYTVSLTSGLLDDDAESLQASSFTFTTTALGDMVRPTFATPGYTAVPNPGTETDEMLIDWNDGSDDTTLAANLIYRVYRANSSGCFSFDSPDFTTGPGVTQAVISGLNSRTSYTFIVRAVDAEGNESLNMDQRSNTTFTSFLQNVFTLVSTRCDICHEAGGQAVLAGINMNYATPATVYNSWVGQPSQCVTAGFPTRVVAGDAAMSFLWDKISQVIPTCGSRMPLTGGPLTAAEQDVFFDWIEEGAIDN